ncbi:MAG TPA: serine hydrolase domain-containing protein [Chitinophagaceae bacterium]
MQNKPFSTLIAFLLLAVLITYSQKSNAQSGIVNEKYLDSVIAYQMRSGGLIGIGAAVIVDKEVVWTRGYGYADKENKIPYTINTVMNAGSIAKTFTGVCMMRLAEERKLSLDEDINTYLPFKVVNPYFPNEKITLRDIATHSSGLADREPFYSDSLYFYDRTTTEPLGEFLKNYFVPGGKYYSLDNFYKAKPGDYWEYSNIASSLAGYIVELKTGQQLNNYSRILIQQPLGMDNTGWFLSEIDLSRHSKLYKKQGDTTITIPLYVCTTYPDGGIRTTVSDLSKFFIALLNEGSYKKRRILRKETVDEMQRFQFSASKKPANLELAEKNEAIFWRSKMNVTKIGNGGTDPGIKTEMLTDLSKEAAVILFTNTDLDDRAAQKAFYSIFNELHQYGLSVKRNK